MAKYKPSTNKLYVLDTNILIHDPNAIFAFEEHDRAIPMAVLEELDKLKGEKSSRGVQARKASRIIDDLIDHAKIEVMKDQSITVVYSDEIEKNGRLLFIQGMNSQNSEISQIFGGDSKDNQIIWTAINLRDQLSKTKEKTPFDIILVSNDTNVRIKSKALGIKSEIYRRENVIKDDEGLITGDYVYEGTEESFWNDLDIEPCENKVSFPSYRVNNAPEEWYPGQLILVKDTHLEFRVIDVEKDDSSCKAIIKTQINYRKESRKVFGINARDAYQNHAFNLMLSGDYDLVTMTGMAGSGKTMLAMSCALELITNKHTSKKYKEIIVTRDAIAMIDSENIGFLPGDQRQKLEPWLGGFTDNIAKLCEGKNSEMIKNILENKIKFESLSFMRGRSIQGKILIIDEAQNLSSALMQSIISRAGEDCLCIVLGSIYQIDNAYLNAGSNGLSVLTHKFKDWKHSGHIDLKFVHRSRLAAKVEELFNN